MRARYDGQFGYQLCGGPYAGREIVRADLQQSVEISFEDPYEINTSSYAVYGTRTVFQEHPRELHYWGRKPCPPSAVPWVSDPRFWSG